VYETVTISGDDNSSPYWDDPRNIIPAPVSGCDGITDPQAAADEPVVVCHATGDPERPYALRQPPEGFGGHEFHRGDLIPAPGGTCPGLDGYAVPTPEPTSTPAPTREPTATATASPTPGGDEEGDEGAGGGGLPRYTTAAMVAVTQGATAPAQQLPFTGFELWLIAAAGLGMTLMGLGLRVLDAAQPPEGVTR
jgi:hypothetical protein